MMDAINTGLTYQAREAEGTQAPSETLRLKSGTCRDYAWLMVEALRRRGWPVVLLAGTFTMPLWMGAMWA